MEIITGTQTFFTVYFFQKNIA